MTKILTELRSKPIADLRQQVAEKQRALRVLRARALAHDLKGVRQVRALRREVAQLLTLITQHSKVSVR